MRSFASDNFSGVHPQVLEALARVNCDHAMAYGYDQWTEQAKRRFQELFEAEVETFFVFNGTGANILALSSCVDRFSSVLCTQTAHIHVDECGAPERQLGIKVIALPTAIGKLTPADIKPHLEASASEHHSRPTVVSISQSTELGTLYTPEEIAALAELVHHYGLYLHVDGARIANAVAASKASLNSMIIRTGVDILSFGGTKNGLMLGEAVVFCNRALAKNASYLRKQNMQLASKMRYIAAQFLALFENDLWLQGADHANKQAKRLEEAVRRLGPQYQILYPVQANALFVKLPKERIAQLQESCFFWIWDEEQGVVRWMTSFDTTAGDIENFIQLLSL